MLNKVRWWPADLCWGCPGRCIPASCWLCLNQLHTCRSFWICCPPGPPDPFPQSCFPARQIPGCNPGLHFFRCNTLHLSLLNFMRFYGINGPPSMEGFLAHSSRQSRSSCRVLLLSLVSLGPWTNFVRVHLIPSSRSLVKIISSIEPSIDPLGTPFVAGCHFEKEHFATTQWVLPFSPIPTHGTDHLPRPLYVVSTRCWQRDYRNGAPGRSWVRTLRFGASINPSIN